MPQLTPQEIEYQRRIQQIQGGAGLPVSPMPDNTTQVVQFAHPDEKLPDNSQAVEDALRKAALMKASQPDLNPPPAVPETYSATEPSSTQQRFDKLKQYLRQ